MKGLNWALIGFASLVLFACGDDASSVNPIDVGTIPESVSSEDSSSSLAKENKSSSSVVRSSSSEKESSAKSSSSSKNVDSSSSSAQSSSSAESSSSLVASSSSIYGEFIQEGFTKDSFKNPDIDYQTMTDERDGRVYRILTVGTGDSAMTWMAENLNFAETSSDSALSVNLKSQTSCPYDKAEYCEIAGRIYTWTAAMNINESYKDSIALARPIVPIYNHQGVCPSGWHVPTMNEFISLRLRVEEIQGSKGVGTALKSKVGWDSLSAGTDIFGLSFIPYASASYGYYAYVWTAEVDFASDGSTTSFMLSSDMSGSIFVGGKSEWGGYVRCVKNKDRAYGTFRDSRDGKYYKYARIGNMKWMAENLNYGAKDSIGTCFWDDDENCSGYGRFYTYQEAKTVCPDGWRLPSDDDFDQMEDDIGGWQNAATLLRSTEWESDLPGLNGYGFSAKPTGFYRWGKSTDSFGREEPQKVFDSGAFYMWVRSISDTKNGTIMAILDFSESSITSLGAENAEVPVRCIQEF